MKRSEQVNGQPRSTPAFGDDWRRRSSGLWAPAAMPKRRYAFPVAVDLFCGCGGFSLGFMQAGFQVVAACDNNPEATITYMHNLGAYPCEFHYATGDDKERLNKVVERLSRRGEVSSMLLSGGGLIKERADGLPPGVGHFFFGDVRKFTGRQILDAVGLEQGQVDCVMGGPPCQGFSTAGKREVMDPRNSLVFEFARLVTEIRPQTMIFENVPAIRSMVTPEGLNVIDALCHVLEAGGFSTYEALKRSLVGTSARAAFRKSSKGEREPEIDGDDESVGATIAQMELF